MFERDRLLAGVDLGQLADELLGPRAGNQRSGSWRCPNPHHAQTGRTPPLSIFRTRHGDQRWRCHGCGAGGTAIDLVMIAMNRDVRGAMELLATRTVGAVDVMASPRPRPVAPDPHRLVHLAAFADNAAARLWQPAGRDVRRWLIDERGLPGDVLRRNKVGADLGSYRHRPAGMPRGGPAAVFPAIHDDRVVYAQLRRLRAGDGEAKFLNPAASLATNPRVARYRPATPVAQRVVVIAEGPIDALSAAAAGFRALAVLGAAAGDELVARRVANLPGPLVVAFDADDAGHAGAERLRGFLAGLGRPAARLPLPDGVGDLNDWHRSSDDWTRELAAGIAASLRRTERPPLSIA